MNTVSIRAQLHDFIENGDEKLLELMYSVARKYTHELQAPLFNKEEIELFTERRNKRISGETKLYSWEEAKNIVIGKKNVP